MHTHLNQTIAATGRLSSTEPNLQNIPIKTEDGRRIRQVFIAPQGSVILAADYSQIELRLLAAFSKDPELLRAYQDDRDIHALTASFLFGIPSDQVSAHQRMVAKTVNFGVIYGQSAFGLGQQLGVPPGEAKTFIDRFYQTYSHVQNFREQILQQASQDGFVRTHLGRRRYLPDLMSHNKLAKQNAERAAFNTVFQGSAADLIKKAMIHIQAYLEVEDLRSKMILQVHDELLFEVPQSELESVSAKVRTLMESAFELDVPLKVSLGHGRSWGDAH